jgi:hypothetical protein
MLPRTAALGLIVWKDFFVSAATEDGSLLAHTDLNGDAHLLWQTKGTIQPPSDLYSWRDINSMGGAIAKWTLLGALWLEREQVRVSSDSRPKGTSSVCKNCGQILHCAIQSAL